MSFVYLDSSVAVRAIHNVPERDSIRRWIDSQDRPLISSRLLRTEVVRTLLRDGRSQEEAEPVISRVNLLAITDEVHNSAERLRGHVRALDALHIATALCVGVPVLVATHDARMAAVAHEAGLAVVDPCAPVN